MHQLEEQSLSVGQLTGLGPVSPSSPASRSEILLSLEKRRGAEEGEEQKVL
jgi:hypothetical protein